MAENITLSVSQRNKEVWSKFKAVHPSNASPTIMKLIRNHLDEHPEQYSQEGQDE
ncbi:hypothetical protein [uncultured Methanoculleus sp.]|uniref:hypothetical protein n=1 Tax=uncultured Methanoculleus sp. TaxID=183762 RepID=UPI003204C8A7